jgi:hypothetical protein
VFAEKEMVKMIEKHKGFLKERTNSEKLDITDIAVGKMSAKAVGFDIKGKKLAIEF